MATEKDMQHETVRNQEWPELVHRAVESLRYGVVQIVIYDGRVTQIEKTEKRRLDTIS
jgi:hypothetical protein